MYLKFNNFIIKNLRRYQPSMNYFKEMSNNHKLRLAVILDCSRAEWNQNIVVCIAKFKCW